MVPDENEPLMTPEGLSVMVERLASDINFKINTAGQLADLCFDGNEQSATHGLQMCYDRLVEAEAWAKRALSELKSAQE